MAMTAPDLQPRYIGPRMGQLPTVHATDEAFGAGNARNMAELAAVGQRAGLSMLAQAQEEQRRIDQAYVRDAMNQARLEIMEGADAIYRKAGRDAENAPEEMAVLIENTKRRAGAVSCTTNSCSTGRGFGGPNGGGNIERQRMLDSAWQSLSNDYTRAALRHRLNQRRVYENDTIDAQNISLEKEVRAIAGGNDIITGTAAEGGNAYAEADGETDNADVEIINSEEEYQGEPQSVTVTASRLPAENVQRVKAEPTSPLHIGDAIAIRINKMRENVAVKFSGRHPDIIRQKQDEAESVLHSTAIEGIASRSPVMALEYMEQSRVREIMPAATWKKYHTQLQKSEDGDWALQAFRADMDGSEFILKATERAEGDGLRFQNLTKMWDSFAASDKKAKDRESIKKIDEVYGIVYDAKGSIANIKPEDFRKNPEEVTKALNQYVALQEAIMKVDGRANVEELKRLNAMSDDELTEWMVGETVVDAGTKDERRVPNQQLLNWYAAGNKKLSEPLLTRSAEGSKDVKGFTGAATLDVGGVFKAAFPTIYQTTGWFGGKSPTQFDSKNPAHQQLKNNFELIYNQHLGDFEGNKERKSTYKEQESTAHTLVQDVRLNPSILENGRFLTARDAAKAMDTIPVAKIAVLPTALPEEAQRNVSGNGKTYIIAELAPPADLTPTAKGKEKSTPPAPVIRYRQEIPRKEWHADLLGKAMRVERVLMGEQIGGMKIPAGSNIVSFDRNDGYAEIWSGGFRSLVDAVRMKPTPSSPNTDAQLSPDPEIADSAIMKKLRDDGYDIKWVPNEGGEGGIYMATHPSGGKVHYLNQYGTEMRGNGHFTYAPHHEGDDVIFAIAETEKRIAILERLLPYDIRSGNYARAIGRRLDAAKTELEKLKSAGE